MSQKQALNNFESLLFEMSRNDLQQIIHIVDLDGAFVPDSYITQCGDFPNLEKDSSTRIIYSLIEIKTNNPKK